MAKSTATAKSTAKQDVHEAPVAEVKPRKKAWLLKILIALVVLAGGAGGAWFAMKEPAAAPEAVADPSAAEKAPEKMAVFVPLDAFTVNLQPENGDQYLQVGLAAKVNEATTVDAIKQQMPEVRNRVLLLLSSKKASEISTVEGKQKLSAEVLTEMKQAVGPEKLQQGIIAVLFTSFIIQ